MVKYIYKEFKTAINKLKFPDSWFWCRYTINPYSGCEHSCIYCDARSQRYYLDQNFENEVIIKVDFDKKLDLRIKRARKLLIDVIGPGGVCDAYQPIEEKVKNTLKILKVIKKYQFPVNIATKNKLITRDLEILNKIAENTWCTIGFSITTTNEELAKFLEPFSSPPADRLKVIKIIKNNFPKIQVGTYFIPIIPFLEDDYENLEDVIKQTKQAGADFILFSPGLTLRDLQSEFFINKLKNSRYKFVVKPLLELYKDQMYPPSDYVNKIHYKLYDLCKKYKISMREKRWIPKDYRKWNYRISEILLNKEYLDFIKTGKSDNTMKWAGLYLNNLEESILDVYKRGDLSKLRNFTKRIIKYVEPFLEKSKDLKRKTGLDKFL
ncbi:MAG: radical SAM protein [Promethearchaeota archaeon]